MIGLTHYLTLAAILFTIGVFGIFVNRKNVIVILMSIELILLAVNINLVAFSVFLHDVVGQIAGLVAEPVERLADHLLLSGRSVEPLEQPTQGPRRAIVFAEAAAVTMVMPSPPMARPAKHPPQPIETHRTQNETEHSRYLLGLELEALM